MPQAAERNTDWLVLGLGNPGRRYRATRHNRGREVVQELARRRGLDFCERQCATSLAYDGTRKLLLGLPETFMNRSGFAARCLVETRRLRLDRLLVIYDDVSLPLGTVRLRPRGGPGGQKGMASVIEILSTDAIVRLRLGILPPDGLPEAADLSDFVLSPFGASEAEAAAAQVERAADACESWLREGSEATMNRFNAAAPDSDRPEAGRRRSLKEDN